ncbi:MAG: hypothetical protein EZS28_012949 [Streblomastix strix]|uniref:Uncharacterized protein n=1 Tax=Streblomastix strix TaxID=222440 RepID=A0A5J4WA49_9EUKA|nr:MAG: hypothetical protein EZS28_012949 [Streblomastix strix]
MSFSELTTPIIISNIQKGRKDTFFLEILALTGEITAVAVEQSQQFIAEMKKLAILSLLITRRYLNNVDCLLIVTINGEWLFLQWHESNFFPLGTGSLLDAVQPFFSKPIKRRFRLDPQDNEGNEEINNFMCIDDIPIVRVSFRAICVVDETVFVGFCYDGPDVSFMYNISEKMNETLGSMSQSQHWGPNMVAGISNGLEETWLTQQMNSNGNPNIVNFIIKISDETEKDMCDSSSESRIRLNSSSIHLNSLNKKVTSNITTANIIVDTKELPCLMNISFDFQTQKMHLFGRVLISIHPSTSRIVQLEDDGEQLDYIAIMKTIRGADFVACDNLISFTGNEVFHILSGKEIISSPNQNGEESRSDELLQIRDKIRSQNLTQRSFGIILNQNHQCRSCQMQLQSMNIRPFILIASACLSLIMNVSGSYLFQFPVSFLDPPMAAMYVTVRQGNGMKSLSPYLSYGNEEKHKKLKDASTMDKIFIGSGKQLLVIMNGKAQVHHMKDKCIKDIVLIPTSKQNTQKIESKLKISEEANKDSLQSVISEEQDSHHFHKFWKTLSTSAIFISITCGSPAIIIQPKFKVPSHIEEDRVLLAMGNGRTGSLHLDNLSNKLVLLAQTTYLGNHSFVTSCRQLAGSTMRNIILNEAEIMNKQNIQSLNSFHQNLSDIPLTKDAKSNSQSIEKLSNSDSQTKIISKMFIISKDQISSHKKIDIGIRTEGKVVAFHEAQASSISSTSIGPAMSHIPIQQNIDQNNRLVWHSPPLLTKEQCIMCENGEINIGFTEEAQLEHGAIGDNIIVVSHKCIASILLWHPAVPQLLNKQWPNQSRAPITRLTATAMGNERKKMAYLTNIFKMSNQNKENKEKEDKEEDKLENKTMQRNLAQEQIKLQRNVWMMPQVLTTVATIKGPSQITSITTSMICGRHFVVVCFENSAEVQIYRLDTFENARAAIIERENMWNFANKTVCDGYGKFKYPLIKQPNMNTNTTATGQFIEIDENSGKFLANINNSYLTLVRVFDIELNDYAHTCVLTTFERHVRKLGSDENVYPDEQMMDKHEEKLYGGAKRYSIDKNYQNRQNFK